jgi:hypothetical protein
VDMCDISMKEMQSLQDKHEKLKVKERALFLTGVVTFPRWQCRSSAVRRWLPTAAARVRVRGACGGL